MNDKILDACDFIIKDKKEGVINLDDDLAIDFISTLYGLSFDESRAALNLLREKLS